MLPKMFVQWTWSSQVVIFSQIHIFIFETKRLLFLFWLGIVKNPVPDEALTALSWVDFIWR